jgi:hypothetical protein
MKLPEKVKADFYAELLDLARKYSPTLELANFCIVEIFDKLNDEVNNYDNLNEIRVSLYIKLLQSPCLGGAPCNVVGAPDKKRRLVESKYVVGMNEVRFRSK